jgi:chromosome segregation ATPase
VATPSERIAEVQAWTHTFTERVNNVQKDFDRCQSRLDDIEPRIGDINETLARTAEELKHKGAELEKLRSNRQAIAIVVLSTLLAVVGNVLGSGLRHLISPSISREIPQQPQPVKP